MKINYCIAFLFLISMALSAQTKGVVLDSITRKPIPYVSIWIENENSGGTTNEDGSFEIHTDEKSKRLIFSALGYETKKMVISKVGTVYLNPKMYELNEVVIIKRKLTRTEEIGKTDYETSEAFDNGSRVDAKFFPYRKEYRKTKFIKQVAITTDGRISGATIKIHLYSVDNDGLPGEELLKRDLVVSVSKGVKKTYFDVMKFNLKMPQNGIFVGFEKLLIENNRIDDERTMHKSYAPFVLYNWVERDFSVTFSKGKWSKKTQSDDAHSQAKIMMYEPAINLILTN